jgi:hypothetical protein
MKTLNLYLASLVGCSLLLHPARAQETNQLFYWPTTKLEAFETNIATLIIKGTTEVGAVSTDNGVVSVKCKEMTDTAAGRKEHGIAVEISRPGQSKDVMLIDYEELAALLNAIDYLSKLDVTISALNTFDAAYTTKAGFRIAALGTRRTGLVQFGVRDVRFGAAPVPLSREEMTRLWSLIDVARKQLDALR